MKQQRFVRRIMGSRVASLGVATALFLVTLPSIVYGQQFVYVAGPTANAVAALNLNVGTGALTQVPGSPFAAGVAPLAVAVDRAGRYVYVANSGSNSVSAYAINAFNGALSPIFGSPFAVT